MNMNNIYSDLKDILQTYVFGGDALTTNQDLITELICMFGVVLLVSLPFLLVWKIIKMI